MLRLIEIICAFVGAHCHVFHSLWWLWCLSCFIDGALKTSPRCNNATCGAPRSEAWELPNPIGSPSCRWAESLFVPKKFLESRQAKHSNSQRQFWKQQWHPDYLNCSARFMIIPQRTAGDFFALQWRETSKLSWKGAYWSCLTAPRRICAWLETSRTSVGKQPFRGFQAGETWSVQLISTYHLPELVEKLLSSSPLLPPIHFEGLLGVQEENDAPNRPGPKWSWHCSVMDYTRHLYKARKAYKSQLTNTIPVYGLSTVNKGSGERYKCNYIWFVVYTEGIADHKGWWNAFFAQGDCEIMV